MQERQETRLDVVGDGDGLGVGLCEQPRVLLEVTEQEGVGFAGEALLSQEPLEPLRPQPHPVHHPPCPCGQNGQNRC